jgi:hypothetical protein
MTPTVTFSGAVGTRIEYEGVSTPAALTTTTSTERDEFDRGIQPTVSSDEKIPILGGQK